MKTKKLFASFLCLLGIGTTLFGQKSDTGSVRPPVIGLGFKISQINVSDLFESTPPANKLLLTITPIKNFRIEGSLGYLKRTQESSTGTDLDGQSIFYGVTALGMWQKGNTNFYAGPRMGILNFSDEQEFSGYTSTGVIYSYTKEATGKTRTIGGVIGAEYFFSRHFSIGAEIAISSATTVASTPVSNGSSSTTENETEAKSQMTETGLMARFYF